MSDATQETFATEAKEVWFKDEFAFIARMVQEYKAMLVKRIEGLQAAIENSLVSEHHEWCRQCIIVATDRLAMSDAELLPFIKAAEPKLSSD